MRADHNLGARARFHVPMSCAALALIRGADYPEVVRVYDEGHKPRTFAEADRAALDGDQLPAESLADDALDTTTALPY